MLKRSEFTKWMVGIGAVLVVVLGIIVISRGAALAGTGMSKPDENSSPKASVAQATETLTGKAAANAEAGTASGDTAAPADGSDVQYITSTLSSGAYPDISVQSGVPVEWTIHADKGVVNGCNKTMVISAYGLQVALREGDNLIKFTPTDTGTITYSCWMGMITGQIQVNEAAEASSGQVQSDPGTSAAISEPALNPSTDTSAISPTTCPTTYPAEDFTGGCC